MRRRVSLVDSESPERIKLATFICPQSWQLMHTNTKKAGLPSDSADIELR